MVATNDKSNPGSEANHCRKRPMVNNPYQGMALDAVTGLYDERFRNYSPPLGRWTSQDPLRYTNRANICQFVNSSPVGNVDAEGEATERFRIPLLEGEIPLDWSFTPTIITEEELRVAATCKSPPEIVASQLTGTSYFNAIAQDARLVTETWIGDIHSPNIAGNMKRYTFKVFVDYYKITQGVSPGGVQFGLARDIPAGTVVKPESMTVKWCSEGVRIE